MKKILTLFVAVLSLTACSKEKPFESLKVGMTGSKVIELVGEPDQKMPIFVAEWWTYQKDNKLIVMNSDTVVRVVLDLKSTQDSMKVAGQELQDLGDNMKKQLDSIQ